MGELMGEIGSQSWNDLSMSLHVNKMSCSINSSLMVGPKLQSYDDPFLSTLTRCQSSEPHRIL
jgi:hypothetical protein